MPRDAGTAAERPLLLDPNLHVVFGVTLMAVLGVASVTPAFPAIADAFGLSAGAVGLLVAAFTLPGVLLTPVAGVLGDRLGRKRVLIPALVLFAIAGAACGLARDFHVLLALRVVQGVGAAALGVLNQAVIGDLYEGPRRPTAFGYNAAVLSVGTAVYPAIGGGLTVLGWHYPFFLPILALPVAVFVAVRLDTPALSRALSFGAYLRSVLVSVKEPQAIGLFWASLATFVLLYGAILTYTPFLLARVYGASPAEIGMVFAAMSMATALTSFRLGALARRFSSRTLILAGFAAYVVSLWLIPIARAEWLVIVGMLLFGAANGINIPSILSVLNDLAPAEFRAAFLSVNGTLLRLGQTLGPLVAAALFRWGFSGVYHGNALLAAATFILFALTMRAHLVHAPSALEVVPEDR